MVIHFLRIEHSVREHSHHDAEESIYDKVEPPLHENPAAVVAQIRGAPVVTPSARAPCRAEWNHSTYKVICMEKI